MKILGLRVREVGSFRQPVALEGLTGGLDVLAGPNEFGKSTLFRALQAAFTVQHTTKAAGARDWMVPASGGAPTIEVDFETAGARYRLRKRFFTGARASLQRLDGDLLLRGADAEARLSDILGLAGGPDRLGLLWVGQRQALEPLLVGDSARDGIKSLIADEVTRAVGGGAIDLIRRKVAERLGALVTDARRLPKGAHKEAGDLEARLMREATEQRAAVARGRERLERLGGLRERHAGLAEAGQRREWSDRVAIARQTLEAARAAADKRRTAEEMWKRLDREQSAAAKDLAAFDQQAAEISRIAARQLVSDAQLAQQSAAAVVLIERLAAARSTHDIAVLAEQSAHQALDAARREQAVRSAEAAFAALRRRLTDAEAVAARMAEIAPIAGAKPALAALRARADTAQRAIEALEARQAAASVRVRIEYEKGGQGKILRDGVPLAADIELALDLETGFAISGIGRLTVTPANPDGAGSIAAQLAAARDRLAGLLSEALVATLPELSSRAEAQLAALAEQDRLAARLDGLCPEGLPALRQRVGAGWTCAATGPADRTGAVATRTQASDPTDLAGLEAAVRTAATARLQSQASLSKLQSDQQSLELSLAALQAEAAMLAERAAAIVPPDPSVTAPRASRLAASQTSAARAREAILALQALREAEPDSNRLLSLDAALKAALAAETQGLADINSLAVEMAGLESLLERDALDGIGERLIETEEALALATRSRARITSEIAALDLLADHLSTVERGARDSYLAPVMQRLAPYLGLVLPGAELELGAAFDAAGLTRDGRSEAMARLSEGTREQIAVLVRLGLGRLLADRGKPMPLILDDALVYSDDDRIAASFAALEQAAVHHQVMVLTCRAKAFQPLGGARLMLEPWQINEE